ncbi:MAG: hypothetical protein JWN52_4650 [Actinomycetia bacterium]|nr:hypothetical protein [Actinomycetes bacterium]
MRLEGPAQRLTIFIVESDQFHHKPLYTEIVQRAHAMGLAGASVMRGIEGTGRPPISTPAGSCRCRMTFRWRSSSWTPRRRSPGSSMNWTS